jgi:hypothetical protein
LYFEKDELESAIVLCMSAAALHRPGYVPIRPGKPYLLAFGLFTIMWALNISHVRDMTEERCDTRRGPFISGFSNGFQTYSCECRSTFNFAEAIPTAA